MKTLYLECNMGASGDMIMAALLDLYDKPKEFVSFMNGLGLPGVQLVHEEAMKCGVKGSSVHVLIHGQEEQSSDAAHGEPEGHEEHHHPHDHGEHPHHHHGRNREDVLSLIESLDLSETVKKDAVQIYNSIAQAEASVHNKPVGEIHFHEVGATDAIVDIVGCCQLMSLLKPETVIASPVCVGSGEVHCAHGILPVPAPATAILLHGIPIYAGDIKSELCTPTGAALLKHFVSSFEPMPPIRVEKTGYGMGQKDFPTANCLRAFWGEGGTPREEVVEINCNLDDMTGEAIGFAVDRLLDAGALDVYITPIIMKKGRPAQMLTCLCRPQQEQLFARLLLTETTTIGVRFNAWKRMTLTSEIHPVETPYGTIRWKSSSGSGIEKGKPEYGDVQKAAKEHHVSFQEVRQAAEFASQIGNKETR